MSQFDPEQTWMFGRIFGLDGPESYRELRLELLCCPHRLRRGNRSRMNESIHGEKTAPELQDELTEVTRHREAISEVLRAIASSPHDLQPIFDTILDSASRLCQAEAASLRLSEEGGLRRVAMRGDPLSVSQGLSSVPVLL